MENLVKTNLFKGIYNCKTVLITGNTGFKGSWLALWLMKLGANVIGYSKNIISKPSHFSLLNLKYKTYFNDILDIKSLNKVILKHKPDIVFHLAAQSLVIESYKNPFETYSTNVIGTLNVLNASLKNKSVKVFINVTTDKVYENIENKLFYKETDRLGGFDMYSSSKACSEILTASFQKSFLQDSIMLLASARAGNVIGGGDWAKDRLIPDLMRGLENNQKKEIRSPKSVRPWEHVLEPLSGYLLLGQQLLENKKEFAQSWNFGPNYKKSYSVETIIEMIKNNWDKINFKINEDKSKKYHESEILKLDCSKAFKKLYWKPVWDIETTIKHTTYWYKNFYEKNEINTYNNLSAYISDAKLKSLIWTK